MLFIELLFQIREKKADNEAHLNLKAVACYIVYKRMNEG